MAVVRRTVLLSAAGLLLGLAIGPVFAGSKSVALNTDDRGVMLHGYDPVAYFTESQAVPGSADISVEHEGATYYFSSVKNRQLFVETPSKFLPAYGGFCAMGAVFGKKIDVDPQRWRIVDGRLYVNASEGAQTKWHEDIPGHIKEADAEWPAIRDIPAQTLNAQ